MMIIFEIAMIYIMVSCRVARLIGVFNKFNYDILDSYLVVIKHIDTFKSIIIKILYSIAIILPFTVLCMPALAVYIPTKLFLDKYL